MNLKSHIINYKDSINWLTYLFSSLIINVEVLLSPNYDLMYIIVGNGMLSFISLITYTEWYLYSKYKKITTKSVIPVTDNTKEVLRNIYKELDALSGKYITEYECLLYSPVNIENEINKQQMEVYRQKSNAVEECIKVLEKYYK